MAEIEGDNVWHDVIITPPPGPRVLLGVNDQAKLQQDNAVWLKNRVIERFGIVESLEVRSAITSTGPSDLFDCKAITDWTSVTAIAKGSVAGVLPGDIVIGRITCHARIEKDAGGYLGFRPTLTVNVDGTPVEANAFTRRWLGAAGAHVIYPGPVDTWFSAVMPALSSGVVSIGMQIKNTIAPSGSDDVFVMNPWHIDAAILRYVAAP